MLGEENVCISCHPLEMKKYIFTILITLISLNGFCQFERVNFDTDSTEVELVRNSVYRIWEETYKNKDSIFYSVSYIKDTTQLHKKGWKRKNGDYIGEWSEYKIDGTWLYTIDYTNNNWEYNQEEFKFQSLKNSMKVKADKILIDKFGKEFFDSNIIFRFNGHTYIGKWEAYETGTFWMQDKYLGSWIEPIEEQPNSYVFDYTIKLGRNETYNDMLRVELDSIGNLINKLSRFEVQFKEIRTSKKSAFSITNAKAIKLCNENKIEEVLILNYESNLRFGWRKLGEYPGQYYYEVVSFIDEELEGECPKKCLIKKYYYVWRFDPWTSDLIHKEKMVQYTRWSNGHGVTSGYEKINQ